MLQEIMTIFQSFVPPKVELYRLPCIKQNFNLIRFLLSFHIDSFEQSTGEHVLIRLNFQIPEILC